jgi:hypothetical protein
VKIHHEALQKCQLTEAQVLAEEMQEKVRQKIYEEDKRRAEAIAKKFETDTEELRKRREKEGKELIELLEQKRMKLLSYNVEEQQQQQQQQQQQEQVKGHDHGGGNNDHGNVALEDNEQMDSCIETSSSSSSSSSGNYSDGSSEESDSEEELEIVGLDSTKGPLMQGLMSEDIQSSSVPVVVKPLQKPQAPAHRKSSPTSVDAAVFSSKSTTAKDENNACALSARQKIIHNSRKMLRNKLKAKQIEHGNMWLARYVK